jgi:AcrR family transcriptional regulator
MPKQSRPDLHRALLTAGEQLIAAHGLGAIHSNAIARAAGVGVGTFYAHFRDKHELARELAVAAWRELGARLEEVAPATLPASAEARVLTTALVDYALDFPLRFRLLCERHPVGPGRPALAISLRPFESRMRLRQARGEIDDALDPELTTRVWWSAVSGTLVWWSDPSRAQPRSSGSRQAAADSLVAALTPLHPGVLFGRGQLSSHPPGG